MRGTIDRPFERVVGIDVQAVSGIAQTGDAVYMVVESPGMSYGEQSGGFVDDQRVGRTYAVFSSGSKISTRKTPSAK